MAGKCRFSLNEDVLYEHVTHDSNASEDLAGMVRSEQEVIRIVQEKKLFQEKDQQLFMEGFFLRNLVRVREMSGWKKKLDILDKWMKLREEGVKYAEYLSSFGIQSVAIYGCGIIGKHLLSELEPSICVKYFIDRDAEEMKMKLPVYGWKDIWPDIDCIILTLMEGEEKVERDIKEKTDKKVLVWKDWITKTKL